VVSEYGFPLKSLFEQIRAQDANVEFQPDLWRAVLMTGHYASISGPVVRNYSITPVPAPANIRVSSLGESHPQALAEPDVNLSAHPAPIIEPRP
jgi:hypothetical protein